MIGGMQGGGFRRSRPGIRQESGVRWWALDQGREPFRRARTRASWTREPFGPSFVQRNTVDSPSPRQAANSPKSSHQADHARWWRVERICQFGSIARAPLQRKHYALVCFWRKDQRWGIRTSKVGGSSRAALMKDMSILICTAWRLTRKHQFRPDGAPGKHACRRCPP